MAPSIKCSMKKPLKSRLRQLMTDTLKVQKGFQQKDQTRHDLQARQRSYLTTGKPAHRCTVHRRFRMSPILVATMPVNRRVGAGHIVLTVIIALARARGTSKHILSLAWNPGTCKWEVPKRPWLPVVPYYSQVAEVWVTVCCQKCRGCEERWHTNEGPGV